MGSHCPNQFENLKNDIWTNASALICDKQRFSIEKVMLENPAQDQIAIRTHNNKLSIGTEIALIRNKLSWGPNPLCTGYIDTGVVEAIGAEINIF